jgi:hypothetical protein
MIKATSPSLHLQVSVLVIILLTIPITYFVISYIYLVWWHNKIFLWNVLIHENGRLTLLGSLFYFDHFVACVPAIVVFALCTAGGVALAGHAPSGINLHRTAFVAIFLLVGAALMVFVAFIASVHTVGWQRTMDYAFQWVERDGIVSKGGNWNQLQLSNLPILLGTIGLSSAFVMFGKESGSKGSGPLTALALLCIGVAAALCIVISAFSWGGWKSFLNPRWLAHSLREIATYPLTGIPIALSGVLLVEYYLSGLHTWAVEPRSLSLILIGTGIGIAIGEVILIKDVNVLAIAQKPSFAVNGLSISYLLCSHVFEHFLDFILIGPLAGGIYALVRWLALLKLGAS